MKQNEISADPQLGDPLKKEKELPPRKGVWVRVIISILIIVLARLYLPNVVWVGTIITISIFVLAPSYLPNVVWARVALSVLIFVFTPLYLPKLVWARVIILSLIMVWAQVYKWKRFWVQLYTEKPLAAVGFTIMLVFLFIAMFADIVAPEGMSEPHLERLGTQMTDVGSRIKLIGPSLTPFHPMGLDNLGRDVLTRIIYGARVSMIVGVGTVALGTTLATMLGVASAWFGGKIDTIIQRIVDGVMVFPWLVTVIIIVTTLPTASPVAFLDVASWGTVKVILALALLDIAWVSRVIRSAAMTVRENQYVEAARAVGASGWRINSKYIIPNIMAPIITMTTLNMGYAILSESTLSFLGHGVPPPNPSWGGMLTGIGQNYLHQAPWLAIFPGIALALVIFGMNVLGDGLRDILDPRMRGTSDVRF